MKNLKLQFENFLQSLHITEVSIPYIVFLALLITVVLLVFVSVYATKIILKNVVGRFIKKTHGKWDDLLIKYGLFTALGYLVSVFILKAALPPLFEDVPRTLLFVQKLLDVYVVFVVVKIIIVFLKATEESIADSEGFIEKPVASYFQLARLILYGITVVLGMSILLSKSPLYFLGAFGALAAVLLLIFKDTILGFVASVQISANDMVRKGDWVQMPKYNTDGEVIAINLNTVKVRNFDQTFTTIPTYFFISESFINWRGMETSGGRRIKRTIQISINSIKFVDAEMRERFKKIDLIKDYMLEKQIEIERHNVASAANTDVIINGLRMTNIGVFRKYIENYLKSNPLINQNMSMLVRHQNLDANGIPIEIYCFTNSVKWAEYENVQSDIFDHLIASVAYFDLVIFQSPSGKDYRTIMANHTTN